MLCTKCGVENVAHARFCFGCGALLNTKSESSETFPREEPSSILTDSCLVCSRNPPRSPHIALWCLLWPGISQILFGQKQKGIVMMVTSSLVNILSGGTLSIPVMIIGCIDAYMVGHALLKRHPVKKWSFFPS